MTVMMMFAVWYGAGIAVTPLTYAMWFAYWQRRFPTIAAECFGEDRRDSLIFAAIGISMGPLALPIAAWRTDWIRYGLKF